jgi:tetratricopeptide (TPR) repeat protein
VVHVPDKKSDESLEGHKNNFAKLLNRNLDRCPAPAKLYGYLKNELALTERTALEAHIDICPACTTALLALMEAEQVSTETAAVPAQWDQIEQDLDNRFHQYVKPMSRPSLEKAGVFKARSLFLEKGILILELFSRPRAVACTGAAIALCIVSIYSYAWLSRPGYFHLVHLEKERTALLRSEPGPSGVLQEGLAWYHQGNYSAAIEKLTIFVQRDTSNYIAYYDLGRSYLFNAKTGLPGFAFKYDKAQVRQGIRHLEKALRLSDGNPFYQEECFWNLGMAFLMLGDFDASREYFARIEHLTHPNLSKQGNARQMIKDIADFKRSK